MIERRPGDHVHGYLTSLRGVMDLYSATSDPRFLRQCETAWQDVVQSEDLLITGGVPEGWSPNKHRTEGCAEADWLRFSLALWKATGNTKYLAMAERTTFNEFALNQFDTGDFGHRVLTETGITGGGAVRAWWCCTLHGLRGFPDVHSGVFRCEEEALYYDMPLDSRTENDSAGPVSFSASATSSLAQDGTVRIAIDSAGETPLLFAFAGRSGLTIWRSASMMPRENFLRKAHMFRSIAVGRRETWLRCATACRTEGSRREQTSDVLVRALAIGCGAVGRSRVFQ